MIFQSADFRDKIRRNKMKAMKKIFMAAIAVCSGAVLQAQQLTGYDIVKRADEVDEGKTNSSRAVLTLTSQKGAVRTREILMRGKDYGDVKKSVFIFSAPKDVLGVAYLSFDYPDKGETKQDSDSWLYMPAMKKTRRISSSGKDDDFMGTDFSYADLGDRGLNKDTFTLLGEESVDGQDCYKVEAAAKDKSEKSPKRVLWFRKDNYILAKAEYYDRQNNLYKALSCSGIKQVDGIWTTEKMFMKNAKTGHSTLLELKDVKYNMEIPDSYFTVSAIERGNIR